MKGDLLFMNKFWSNVTKNLNPYVPGEQPKDKKYIKLNTNENPYPPSPEVISAINTECGDPLKLYPDPECGAIISAVSKYYNLKTDQIFTGNGSDEILAFSFLAFFDPKKAVLFPDITYSFYPVYAKLFNISYKLVTLNDDFSIPLNLLLKNDSDIIFPNPNAPTGRALPLCDIKKILEANPDHIVIVDEAYIDFGGESAVSLIDSYPNLLVIQTFSKSRSLAGLRCGLALGNSELIEALNRVKNSMNSYTLDKLAIKGAAAAINDVSYFNETRNKIIKTRDRVLSELSESGFTVIPSKANFIFASYPYMGGEELLKSLRDAGILVRHFNQPRIKDYLRISIGSDDEMDIFLKKIKDIIKNR